MGCSNLGNRLMLPNCDRLVQSRSEPEHVLESAIAFC
jgi:hypothetical protein